MQLRDTPWLKPLPLSVTIAAIYSAYSYLFLFMGQVSLEAFGMDSGRVEILIDEVFVISSSMLVGLMVYGALSFYLRRVALHRNVEARLAHQAGHDGLTGLANRTSFLVRLEAAINQAKNSETTFAVVFFDLDLFKPVNDKYGHAMGDSLLAAIAGRLRRVVREGDILARLGGDEFAVLARHVHRPDDAATLAARIVSSLSAPFVLEEHEIRISASLGIAVYPEGGDSAEDMLKSADIAMYQAKEKQRGSWAFYKKSAEI